MLLEEPVFKYPKLVMPANVERSTVKIWSSGLALDADLYRPKGLVADSGAPAVVLCHGWGGNKLSGERYAAKFAASGMVSLCFSHGGWAGSQARAVLVDGQRQLGEKDGSLAKVRFIRDLVDPIDWQQSYRSAIDYIEGEPGVDLQRIGAWGTSFGGGIAMHVAANDTRVKALAIQVSKLSPVTGLLERHARQRAIAIARGEIAPIPQGIDTDIYPQLAGTPHLARFLQHNPIAEVGRLAIPTLMLDAAQDELFDIRENSGRAHELLKARGDVPVRYEIIEGIDHYGMYFDGFEQGSEAALAWFLEYL